MNTSPKLSPESEVLIALLAQPEKWKTKSIYRRDQSVINAELEHEKGITINAYFPNPCALFVSKGLAYLSVPKDEHEDILLEHVLPLIDSVQRVEAEKAAFASAQLLKELQEELKAPQPTQA